MKYENFDKVVKLHKEIRELKQLKFELELQKDRQFGIMISSGNLDAPRLGFMRSVFVNAPDKTEQIDGFTEMGEAFIQALGSKLTAKINKLEKELDQL